MQYIVARTECRALHYKRKKYENISWRFTRETDNSGRQVAVKAAAAATAQWCHPGRPQFTDPTRRAMNTSVDVELSGPVNNVIKRLTESRIIGSSSLPSSSSPSLYQFTVSPVPLPATHVIRCQRYDRAAKRVRYLSRAVHRRKCLVFPEKLL